MRTPATDILDAQAHTYAVRVYDEVEKTAEEVVQELALQPHAVFKTLLVRSGREFALAVIPSTRVLSLKQLARIWERPAAEMADPQDISRITGYVRGSVSPLGAKRPLPVFIDASAQALAEMAVSAGRRGAELLIAPQVLRDAAGAVFAAICREE